MTEADVSYREWTDAAGRKIEETTKHYADSRGHKIRRVERRQEGYLTDVTVLDLDNAVRVYGDAERSNDE